MKWKYVIVIVFTFFALHEIQECVARLRLDHMSASLAAAGVSTCVKFFDDRQDLTKERIMIKRSNIHGYGLFANATIPCGAIICDAYTLKPVRYLKNTPVEFSLWGITNLLARVNHDHNPSARVAFDSESHKWVLHALRNINVNEEIMADYLDRPIYGEPSFPHWDTAQSASCQYGHDEIAFTERALRWAVIISKWVILPGILLLS